MIEDFYIFGLRVIPKILLLYDKPTIDQRAHHGHLSFVYSPELRGLGHSANGTAKTAPLEDSVVCRLFKTDNIVDDIRLMIEDVRRWCYDCKDYDIHLLISTDGSFGLAMLKHFRKNYDRNRIYETCPKP